jgi:hypothetical protein
LLPDDEVFRLIRRINDIKVQRGMALYRPTQMAILPSLAR